MKRKLIALLAAITLLCSVVVGMTFTASAAEERGFGMSLSEWKDDFGQGKEYDDGIGIGADAHLKTPLYGETVTMDMEFSVLPSVDFWYVLAFANSPEFNGGSVHSGTDRGALAIMFQPGATSMNFNVFHWKSNGEGGFVREDIALGPVPGLTGGLDATKPFSLDISLFGDDAHITLSQNEEENVYNIATHALLGAISREQICDADGKTYLNIASYADGGALKELKFTSISTLGGLTDARNWTGTPDMTAQGVSLHSDARYLRPFDMTSKYIKVTTDVKMIIGNVDAWVGISFNPTSVKPQEGQKGLNILIRNQGGKLAVQPTVDGYGTGDLKVLQDVTLGKVVFELEEVEGKVQMKINRTVFTHDALNDLTMENITNANGRVYFGFGSYVEGNQSENNVVIENITTDVQAKELIYIEVENMPESGMVGNAISLPQGNVVQVDDEEIAATIAVTDPQGTAVTVSDMQFTPASKGEYTVVYSAQDSHGNIAQNTYKILVIDPDDALSMDSIKDIQNNWNAPYGGVSVVDAGVQVFAHSYYKLPLSMNGGVLRADFHVDGLWDGNDADEATSTDAWVAVGFVNKPAISAPGSYAAQGLYVRLNNRSGKLMISVHYSSPFGNEDIAIEDAFASEFDAEGDVSVEVQKAAEGDGIRLFVNGKEMRHENLKKVYYTDLVDENNCTYLALSAYDNDDADQKNPNVETRCFTLTKLSHEKTEIVEDTTPPTMKITGMPTEGKVGEKVILPVATITDDFDSSLTEQISVKDPDGKAIAVVNRSFTPQTAGEYTVVYTVSDTSGNAAEPQTFKITVSEAEKEGCGSSYTGVSILVSAIVLLGTVCTVMLIRKKNI